MNKYVEANWRKVDKRQLGIFSRTDCFIENKFFSSDTFIKVVTMYEVTFH
jgi:hypothetical protein